MKKLYRSRTNRVFGGLVGGIAHHFETDASLIRLVWLLFVIFTGFFPGVLFYILALFIVPPEPKHQASHSSPPKTP